jgi:hypothetical protein
MAEIDNLRFIFRVVLIHFLKPLQNRFLTLELNPCLALRRRLILLHLFSRESSSRANSSAASLNLSAPALSSAWCTFVTPGMVTIVSPWKWITQFKATWAGVALYLAPIASIACTSRRLFSSPLFNLLRQNKFFFCSSSGFLILTGQQAEASGVYVMMVTPTLAVSMMPFVSVERSSALQHLVGSQWQTTLL